MTEANNPIEEFLSQEIPDEVWHYTSLPALRGIISSGRVWATEARFSNDKTEFVHARDIAAGILPTLYVDGHFPGMPIDDLTKMLNKAFDEGALSPLENQIYIASFSAAPDLLSQWSQYASASQGVSIGFDLRGIRPPTALDIGVTLAPCLYEDAAQGRLIKTALEHFTNAVLSLDHQSQDPVWMKAQVASWNAIHRPPFERAAFEWQLQQDMKNQLLGAFRRTLYDLLRVASHCKNPGFVQEQEWRLALPIPTRRPPTHNTILYRGASGKIPYLAFDFFRTDNRLPITQVMTGPLCAKVDEIAEILTANGYSVPIVPSSIPLRDTTTL